MNLLWKLAIALAVVVSFYSVWDNGQRVRRLEVQVCDTVYQSNARLEEIAYYDDHPAEKAAVLADNLAVLRRFHCPIDEEGS